MTTTPSRMGVAFFCMDCPVCCLYFSLMSSSTSAMFISTHCSLRCESSGRMLIKFLAPEVVPFCAADIAGSYVDACLCHSFSLFAGSIRLTAIERSRWRTGSRGVHSHTTPLGVIVCYNHASKVKPFGWNYQKCREKKRQCCLGVICRLRKTQ